MPCRVYDPTKEQAATHIAARLLRYVNGKLGVKTPENIVKAAETEFVTTANYKTLAPMLCEKISAMNDALREQIVYNVRDPLSRELANWWEKHEAEDQKRLRAELQEKKDKKARDKAIAKLTPRERKLLGL